MARVVVVTGGSTPERHVALAGASQVVVALREQGYEVRTVDTCHGLLSESDEATLFDASVGVDPPTEDELRELARDELGPDLVRIPEVRRSDLLFLVLHGREGEGGSLQSLLELAGLRFIGTGAPGSVLAMDKDVSKRLFEHAGVRTPRWKLWPVEASDLPTLGARWVVKPSNVGSTVGLSVVDDPGDLEVAAARAREFDDAVLVEEYIDGRELTVGILGEEALAVGEIIPRHEIFDYECKYTPGMAREVFPADVSAELAAEVCSLGLRVHRILKLRDFSRVDFRVSQDGNVFCLEANTLPGMTSTSLLPQSASACGISFEELCHRMCQLALGR